MSQLKIKDGNNWVNIPASGIGIPSGGNEGDVLVKSSSTDYATEWGSLSDWVDITSSFTTVTGVTDFEAYYNDKLKIVWLFGRTPTSYRTGNTIATISSTYAGEARNHTIGGFYGGDGVYNETVVNGTTLLARSATGQQIQFSTSFDFYGFYRVH